MTREVVGTKKLPGVNRRGTNDGKKNGDNANISINNSDCCESGRSEMAEVKKGAVDGVGGAAHDGSRPGCTCMCSFCQCIRAVEP